MAACAPSGVVAPEEGQQPRQESAEQGQNVVQPVAQDSIIPTWKAYPRQWPQKAGVDWTKFPSLPPLNPRANAQVIHVAPDGDDGSGLGSFKSPLKSLRAALERATPGAWVVVRGGTYLEGDGDFIGVRLEKRHKGVVVTAYKGEEVIVKPANKDVTYGLEISGDDITVVGLKFEFSRVGATIGDAGRTMRNLVLARCAFDANAGILILPPPNPDRSPIIDGVLLHDVKVSGAEMGVSCNDGPCVNMRYEGLEVVGRASDAGSGADAVAAEAGDNIALIDVKVSGVGADGIDLKATRVAIANATISSVGRNGLKLWGGGDVFGTTIHKTGADASVVFGAGQYRLLHSVVAEHNYKGPTSYSMTVSYDEREPTSIEVANTVFWRNSGGVFFAPHAEVTLRNNVFSQIGNQRAFDHRELSVSTTDSPGGLKKADIGAETSLMNTKPGFADSDAGDFHIGPGSPLRDAGASLKTVPDFDADDAPRVVGKAPDVGAYEFSKAK